MLSLVISMFNTVTGIGVTLCVDVEQLLHRHISWHKHIPSNNYVAHIYALKFYVVLIWGGAQWTLSSLDNDWTKPAGDSDLEGWQFEIVYHRTIQCMAQPGWGTLGTCPSNQRPCPTSAGMLLDLKSNGAVYICISTELRVLYAHRTQREFASDPLKCFSTLRRISYKHSVPMLCPGIGDLLATPLELFQTQVYSLVETAMNAHPRRGGHFS